MGLFDKLFKKENEKENDAETVSEEINTDGWDAITETFNRLYPDQKNPLHYAAMIKWRFGGNDPLVFMMEEIIGTLLLMDCLNCMKK